MSFTCPGYIYKYNYEKLDIFYKIQISYFDLNDFVTKQVFFKSKDGTLIPMFITHKNDLELNSKNPTILYGYGGFNIRFFLFFLLFFF
jgi:prolyl oligopeptidase